METNPLCRIDLKVRVFVLDRLFPFFGNSQKGGINFSLSVFTVSVYLVYATFIFIHPTG